MSKDKLSPITTKCVFTVMHNRPENTCAFQLPRVIKVMYFMGAGEEMSEWRGNSNSFQSEEEKSCLTS